MEVVVNMSKVYAIIGPTASGKTAIISELKKLGLHEIKRYTTATTEDFSVEEFKIVSEEELIKTTTLKIKRHEELAKIEGQK